MTAGSFSRAGCGGEPVRAWVREQRWVLWQGRFLGVALGSPVLRLATVSGAWRICACAMNCRLCPGALCLRVVFDFGSFRVRGSRRADGGSARGRMAAPEPPAEHEAAYYAKPQPQPVARPTTEASTKPGAVQSRNAASNLSAIRLDLDGRQLGSPDCQCAPESSLWHWCPREPARRPLCYGKSSV